MGQLTLPRFSPRRELGRTGFRATAIGVGDVADRSVPSEQCVATLHRAMDAGLNLVDTAPGYEEGYSEEIVGAALRGRREGIFLIDKIDLLDQPWPRGKVSSGGQEAPAPTLQHLSVEECVRYTLTVDPDVALLEMSFPNEQDAALAAAAAFQPLSREQLADVRRRAALAIEGKGAVWWDPQ